MTKNVVLPSELVTRTLEGFTAAQAGDIGPAMAQWHPDIRWTNDTAAGPWAGSFQGPDAVVTMFFEFTTLFEGTFRQELLDICGSDEHIVLLLRELGTKAGHRFDNRAVYVGRAVEGLIVEMFTVDRDREAAAAFWAAVGPVDGPSRRS